MASAALCPSGRDLPEKKAGMTRKIGFSQLQILSSLQQDGIKLVAVLRAECRPLTAEPSSPVAILEARASRRPGLAGCLIGARGRSAREGLAASLAADGRRWCQASAWQESTYCIPAMAKSLVRYGGCLSRTSEEAQGGAGASTLCKESVRNSSSV